MKRVLILAAATALAGGCAMMEQSGPLRAVAELQPTKGNSAKGTVTFNQMGPKVRVSARVSGLPPNSVHGFHVHEKGDCSSGDGMSAGGHFNPGGHPHGHVAQDRVHHAGDMPNLEADSQGNASATFELTTIAVGGGPNDIVGKGLIVHKDPDDYRSQPTGNAGARLACAVIRAG